MSKLDNQKYILGLLLILISILILVTLALIDSYSHIPKDAQQSSSNKLKVNYDYQEVQSYLEANSWNKREAGTRIVGKNDVVNKLGTALLLYLEDNYQLPQNFNDLLGKYLIKVASNSDSINYTNDKVNLLEVIKAILEDGNLEKSLAFRPYSLLVDSSAKRIYLLQGKKQVKAYPIGVGGRENPTPKGEFRIKNKLKLSGKDQKIYGDYWLGIDLWTKGGGYGIHGSTNQLPVSEQKSKGCIRMRSEDLEQLYRLIPLRTKIVIR